MATRVRKSKPEPVTITATFEYDRETPKCWGYKEVVDKGVRRKFVDIFIKQEELPTRPQRLTIVLTAES